MRHKRMLAIGMALGLMLALSAAACGPETATSQPTTEATETAISQPTAEATATAEPTVEMVTDDPKTAEGDVTTTASGLRYLVIEAGDGAAPQVGDIVAVHYRGTLEDGTVFDSSYDRGEPITFPLGRGMVIPGWDEGIALMQVGGRAELIIPPDLAYGENGAGGVIPPDATLNFEVELVEILPGAPEAPEDVDEEDYVTTESGLKFSDLAIGEGASPDTGQRVTAHYTGWLEDGTKFDSSLDRGQPFSFVLGMGQVIAGWDEGIATMKVGGKRQLVVPPELGYGDKGAGGAIPPNATLIFEVELVGLE